MFCPNCGAKIDEGIKFCPNCGKRLAARELQPAPQPAPQPRPTGRATPTVPAGGCVPMAGPAGASRRRKPHLVPVIVAVVAVVAILGAGFATSWFGLAKPKVPTVTYDLGYGNLQRYSPNEVSFESEGGPVAKGVPSEPEGVVDGNVYGTVKLESEDTGESSDCWYMVNPDFKPGVGIYAFAESVDDTFYLVGLQLHDDGTFSLVVAATKGNDDKKNEVLDTLKSGKFDFEENEEGDDYFIVCREGPWELDDDGYYNISAEDVPGYLGQMSIRLKVEKN